jgi:hypothetical protein
MIEFNLIPHDGILGKLHASLAEGLDKYRK